MKNAKFYAMNNAMSWGEGMSMAEAIKNSLKAAGAKEWQRAGFEMFVYELDPAYPITHISDSDGHALHIPKDAEISPMGRSVGRRNPYMRGDDGEFLPAKRFSYKKGATSIAGRHLVEA